MIRKLLSKKTPKTATEAKPNPVGQVSPVPSTFSPNVEKPSIEGSPITEPRPVPPPPAQGNKKTGKARVDKKGIPIITDSDDFEELFQVEPTKKKESPEQFEQLFEHSQLDIYQRLMLMEKKKISEEIKLPVLVERLKTYPRPQKELDLHGLSRARAISATEFFIRNVRRWNIMTVRIIVGKGTHSEGKAVLPDVVESKIIELKRRNWVLYYKWEKKEKSKSGSMIVYLIPGLV